MKLNECEILPGVVIDVEDPKHIGRVKAMVPTWFDSDVMQKEAMPWIWPIGMCGYQRFSKLENGRKIWVLHNKENDLEYWYWPMFEEIDASKPIIDQYDSTELLLCRGGGESGNIYIYYNDAEGIVAKIGETKINITNNNEIHITDSKSTVQIVGGIITIGKEGDSGEPAVLGDKLKTTLSNLAGNIDKLAEALTCPHSPGAQPACRKISQKLNTDIKEILSATVKITE